MTTCNDCYATADGIERDTGIRLCAKHAATDALIEALTLAVDGITYRAAEDKRVPSETAATIGTGIAVSPTWEAAARAVLAQAKGVRA